MLLPFWLALSASLALHAGVLLAPGWDLPFDDESETAPIDATLVSPRPAAVKPPLPAAARPVHKRPPAKPLPPPAPAIPQARAPIEPVAVAPDPEPPVPAVEPMPAAAEPPPAVTPAPTFADRWPRSGRIVYQVSWGEQGLIVGRSEQRWKHDGQHYGLHAETETTGLAALFRPAKVVQDSRGIFDAAGLRPLEFAVMRAGKPKESVRFDPEEGRIILARGDSVPFVPAAQDMLSLFHQLAALPFDVPDHTQAVITGRKLTTFAISVGGESALETPLGLRRVRHLKVSAGQQEDSTEIWLDVETRLPLKIRHRDRKGEVFDQVAIAIETESGQ